ncbi:MAG: hypothetical protein AAAB11_16575, partial [Rhizobium giardinii]
FIRIPAERPARNISALVLAVLHGVEVLRIDTESVEVAVQRTAVAFNSRGCGRGRAKDGDGITEEASGRFTKGGHLFYSLSSWLIVFRSMSGR